MYVDEDAFVGVGKPFFQFSIERRRVLDGYICNEYVLTRVLKDTDTAEWSFDSPFFVAQWDVYVGMAVTQFLVSDSSAAKTLPHVIVFGFQPSRGKVNTLRVIGVLFQIARPERKVEFPLQIDESRNGTNLAKLLVIANTSADKINQLAQDQRVRNILLSPEVRNLMNDPSIGKQISENDVHGLLSNPRLKQALNDKQLMNDLISVSSEQLK